MQNGNLFQMSKNYNSRNFNGERRGIVKWTSERRMKLYLRLYSMLLDLTLMTVNTQYIEAETSKFSSG